MYAQENFTMDYSARQNTAIAADSFALLASMIAIYYGGCMAFSPTLSRNQSFGYSLPSINSLSIKNYISMGFVICLISITAFCFAIGRFVADANDDFMTNMMSPEEVDMQQTGP